MSGVSYEYVANMVAIYLVVSQIPQCTVYALVSLTKNKTSIVNRLDIMCTKLVEIDFVLRNTLCMHR